MIIAPARDIKFSVSPAWTPRCPVDRPRRTLGSVRRSRPLFPSIRRRWPPARATSAGAGSHAPPASSVAPACACTTHRPRPRYEGQRRLAWWAQPRSLCCPNPRGHGDYGPLRARVHAGRGRCRLIGHWTDTPARRITSCSYALRISTVTLSHEQRAGKIVPTYPVRRAISMALTHPLVWIRPLPQRRER
jgi:hypothetical protein